jgi:hypothetical protein
MVVSATFRQRDLFRSKLVKLELKMAVWTHSRTSILIMLVFHHQRWMNDGKFDGGVSVSIRKDLSGTQTTINFTKFSFREFPRIPICKQINSRLQRRNIFVCTLFEWRKLIVVTNFLGWLQVLLIPSDVVKTWNLSDGIWCKEELIIWKTVYVTSWKWSRQDWRLWFYKRKFNFKIEEITMLLNFKKCLCW